MSLVSAAALLVLVARYGFVCPARWEPALDALEILLSVAFAGYPVYKLAAGVSRAKVLSREALGLAVLAVFLAAGAWDILVGATPGVPAWARALHAALVLTPYYLLIHLGIRLGRLYAGLGGLPFRPVALLVLSFASIIGLGTLALCLPRAAARPATPVGVIDAFFMATSATCVTGLTTVDPGGDLSLLGQVALTVLVQIGGLGIMTFALVQSLLVTRGLKLREVAVLRDLLSEKSAGQVTRLLVWMVGLTVGTEAIGACLLFATWRGIPADERLWWSVFHAVSAFCNAGFSLSARNLEPFARQVPVCGVIATLLVLGGLGFSVLIELAERLRATVRAWFRPSRRLGEAPGPLPTPLSVHTRAVLLVSAALALGGALGYLMVERRYSLAGLSAARAAEAALFQSLSARTAGFNTVPMERLSSPGLLWMIGLMAIGASPASTGGGIKTVTAAVLVATLAAFLRGRESVELFRRRVPPNLVNAAVAIVVAYGAGIFVFLLALCVTEPAVPFERLLFEVVSAQSTVGLSTGITSALSVPGKLVIAVAMFVGRVGPLATLMVISRPGKGRNYDYPAEEVLVG